MATKHTTVILPSKEIEDLKEQVKKLTVERDQYQKEAISANIKVEKMKCLMSKEQLDEVFKNETDCYRALRVIF